MTNCCSAIRMEEVAKKVSEQCVSIYFPEYMEKAGMLPDSKNRKYVYESSLVMRELKKRRKEKNGYFSFYSLQCYQGISQKNKLFLFKTPEASYLIWQSQEIPLKREI